MAALVIGAPVMWWHARQATGDSFHLAMDAPRAAKEMNRLAVPSLPAQSAPQMQPESEKTLSASASGTEAGAGIEAAGVWAGARVFVATSTSGLAAGLSLKQKEEIWSELGTWVNRRREETKQADGEQNEDINAAGTIAVE